MSWSKGVREFVESAKFLREKLPNTKFFLIGPMDYGSIDSVPEKYLIENEENIRNLFCLGFKSNVKYFYALADIAVYPTFYAEGGYPRGITEPMSMGKPVISTDNISCRNTIDDGENGFIVPEKNSIELANAIEKLISTPSLLKSFGKKSRLKAIKEFDEYMIVNYVVEKLLA